MSPVLAVGVLQVTGGDRLDFLHRMCTQAVSKALPGAAQHAVFLDAKGHVLFDAALLVRTEDVLAVVGPGRAAALGEHLDRFVVMDSVAVEDQSVAWRLLLAFGQAGAPLPPTGEGVHWPDARRGAPCWSLLLPAADAEGTRRALVTAGAAALEEGDLEVLRVLGGIPRYGVDVDAARLPMEAGLVASAVSFDKGCYLGQEVVLRGTFRGQIQKGLVQLDLPAGAAPGARLFAGEREVGLVTSAVDVPGGGRVGLGYLRRAHWSAGERLAVGVGDGGEAVVRRVLATERDA